MAVGGTAVGVLAEGGVAASMIADAADAPAILRSAMEVMSDRRLFIGLQTITLPLMLASIMIANLAQRREQRRLTEADSWLTA